MRIGYATNQRPCILCLSKKKKAPDANERQCFSVRRVGMCAYLFLFASECFFSISLFLSGGFMTLHSVTGEERLWHQQGFVAHTSAGTTDGNDIQRSKGSHEISPYFNSRPTLSFFRSANAHSLTQ